MSSLIQVGLVAEKQSWIVVDGVDVTNERPTLILGNVCSKRFSRLETFVCGIVPSGPTHSEY
jgi:hypothetical protein